MIDFNGTHVIEQSNVLHHDNRGLYYGDALFETIHIVNGTPLFLEDHWLRLMASMRIMRMEIPLTFTLAFFESSINRLVDSLNLSHARCRITVWRASEGKYTPVSLDVNYIIDCKPIEPLPYQINTNPLVVELFTDYPVVTSLLSTIKSNNKLVNVLAGIFGRENGFDSMLLINEKKMVVETISGNIFLRKQNTIKTPPIDDGCLRGVMRKQILGILKKETDYEIIEQTISPFELQKADELFTTNVIQGVQAITKYRKKAFVREASDLLQGILASTYTS